MSNNIMVFDEGDLSIIESDALKVFLNQEGFRLTEQRRKILEIFQSDPEEHHLSAEEIYQKLSAQGEKIGVSTIYRALHLLVELGLLRELALSEERKYYELCNPLVGDHHHLVCVQCGMVKEFEDPSIMDVGTGEAERRGFSPLNCQFTLYVLCPECQMAAADVFLDQ